MSSSDDWLTRLRSSYDQHSATVAKEFEAARMKLVEFVAEVEKQKRRQLDGSIQTIAMPLTPLHQQQQERRRRQQIVGTAVALFVVIGGVSWYIWKGRRGGSKGGSDLTYSSSSSSSSIPTSAPPSPSTRPSSSSSSSTISPSPSRTRSLLHRTSRSISIAWESLAPRFGDVAGTSLSNVRTGARRLFASFSGPSSAATKQRYRPLQSSTTYMEVAMNANESQPTPNQLEWIQSALEVTNDHLYIGLLTSTSSRTIDELNEILGNWYNGIGHIAYGRLKKDPTFQFSIVLPLPTVGEPAQFVGDIRSRLVNIIDLDVILLPSTSQTNPESSRLFESFHLAREAKGLPTVREELIEINTLTSTATASSNSNNHSSIVSSEPRFHTYSDVVLGGTFDHLHIGHKILLTLAGLLSTHSLVIGLTADDMLRTKKFAAHIESWPMRYQNVLTFLSLVTSSQVEVDMVPLHDMYGPSGDRATLKALVVSEETIKGGPLVNAKRKENGLAELDIIVVKLATLNPDMPASEKISSTHLRQWDDHRITRRNEYLQAHWMRLCQKLNVTTAEMDSMWKLFTQRYSEAHRSYHTLDHIYSLLHCYDEGVREDWLHRSAEVELAIWFHDFIYETPNSSNTGLGPGDVPVAPRPAGSNEIESALEFEQFGRRCKLEEVTIQRVKAMIHATIKHQMPELTNGSTSASNTTFDAKFEADLKYFLDFDLSILAANQSVYLCYTNSIRHEYIYYSYDVYLSGRLGVLQSFLHRPNLYFTPPYRLRAERKARFNLIREIERIQQKRAELGLM